MSTLVNADELVTIANPFGRHDVYHTADCHIVDQIATFEQNKGIRTDLTREQAEQWGKRECKRCKKIRLERR